MGVNAHLARMPVDQLRAIGVKWVRLDCAPKDMTAERLAPIIAHYKGFGRLWIIPNEAPDPVAIAELLISLGETDLEVFNEPEGPWSWSSGRPMEPETYGKIFAAIASAVHGRARLYGPVTGTWNEDYTRRAMKAGMRTHAIDFHGYWIPPEQLGAAMDRARKISGVRALVSEDGYPPFLGPAPYRPAGVTAGAMILRLRNALNGRSWCWYDGPATYDGGLFEWTGPDWTWFTKPTATYREVAAAKR